MLTGAEQYLDVKSTLIFYWIGCLVEQLNTAADASR